MKQIALLYIRNGNETIFPVEDIEQAVKLADSIADSDLLNDFVDYNLFDVYEYQNGELGFAWESDDGLEFADYWHKYRTKNFKR